MKGLALGKWTEVLKDTVKTSLFNQQNLHFVGIDNAALEFSDLGDDLNSPDKLLKQVFTLCVQVLSCRAWSLIKYSHSYPG
jgi:hypothetical protein